MTEKYTKLDIKSMLLLEIDSAIDNVETLLFQCENISNAQPTVQMFRYMTTLQSMILANKINNTIYYIDTYGVNEWLKISVPYDDEDFNEAVDEKIQQLVDSEIDPFEGRQRDYLTGNWFSDERRYYDVYKPAELNDIARLWYNIATNY